jgi:hypothetical protein
MKKTEERQRRYGQDNTNPEIQNSRKNRKKTELTEKTELKENRRDAEARYHDSRCLHK